mgnify:CR=1 FL=1|tara:strand:- start:56757 stop:56915 length:159 start_codon:yes stop_codon:yes gene_type:complete
MTALHFTGEGIFDFVFLYFYCFKLFGETFDEKLLAINGLSVLSGVNDAGLLR